MNRRIWILSGAITLSFMVLAVAVGAGPGNEALVHGDPNLVVIKTAADSKLLPSDMKLYQVCWTNRPTGAADLYNASSKKVLTQINGRDGCTYEINVMRSQQEYAIRNAKHVVVFKKTLKLPE